MRIQKIKICSAADDNMRVFLPRTPQRQKAVTQ